MASLLKPTKSDSWAPLGLYLQCCNQWQLIRNEGHTKIVFYTLTEKKRNNSIYKNIKKKKILRNVYMILRKFNQGGET